MQGNADTEADRPEKVFGEYTLIYQPGSPIVRPHRVVALHGTRKTEVAGEMTWDTESLRLLNIEVQADHRRKGIASAMWHMGLETSAPPRHTPNRTSDGDAWATAVGGELPPKMEPSHPEMYPHGRCPVCGSGSSETAQCTNEDCQEYEADMQPNDGLAES